MADIQPFGESNASPTSGFGSNTINNYGIRTVKAFGCTMVSFDVSADWAGQGGTLTMNLIEDEADGDRLSIPVIGSPYIFELIQDGGDDDGSVIFEHIGIVESFSRSSTSNKKTYSVSIASPLKILDSAKVIMDGYAGLGASVEGDQYFGSYTNIPFGNRNGTIIVDDVVGVNHWFNVSNLINVFAILENDDYLFRVPRTDALNSFGDFGRAAVSKDGIPLVNLMWALHIGINHLPKLNSLQQQQTHGGNLLYGRQNYNLSTVYTATPYFYDFDALGFYNQIINRLGPQYRYAGSSASINEIIGNLCNEANLEYYCYIDINKNTGFGEQTLREYDPNWSSPSNCSWKNLDERKFTDGGKYGGTIRVQTIDKNAFFNANRPFSNISYNLLGLEVPDLAQSEFENAAGVHPGKRPGQETHGVANNQTTYMDPLDTQGLDSSLDGFTEVGTQSLASGGNFPTTDGLFDTNEMDKIRLNSSNLSLQASDTVTMKVVVGGYQSRMVHVPRSLIKHYWGDIQLIRDGRNPRDLDDFESVTYDTVTDSLGLNKNATRSIPVVTQLLDPADMDDFIFIDMQSIFGDRTIGTTIHRGIYTASLFEIRLAMNGFDQWYDWWYTVKIGKRHEFMKYFYPDCFPNNPRAIPVEADYKESTKMFNANSGLGYAGVSVALDCTNPWTTRNTLQENMNYGFDCSGNPKEDVPITGVSGCVSGVGYAVGDCFPTGLFQARIACNAAEKQLKELLLTQVHEKIKTIGDTHYGKSWFVPVPWMKVKEDLDANSLVGQYEYSWECTDSAYIEPSYYYSHRVPQSSQFLQDGKVQNFCNYTSNFVYVASNKDPLEELGSESYPFDDAYLKNLESPFNAQEAKVFNFSEYSLDELAVTKYYKNEEVEIACNTGVDQDPYGIPCLQFDPSGVDASGNTGIYVTGTKVFQTQTIEHMIKHAKPESVDCDYKFLPFLYQHAYNRFLLPFSNTESGIPTCYLTEASGVGSGNPFAIKVIENPETAAAGNHLTVLSVEETTYYNPVAGPVLAPLGTLDGEPDPDKASQALLVLPDEGKENNSFWNWVVGSISDIFIGKD